MPKLNKKKVKHTSPGGAGRGNRGVGVIDDPDRPDCPECGGWMKSKGQREWKCIECNKAIVKTRLDQSIKAYNESLGFDVTLAEAHAEACAKGKRLLVTSAQNNSEVDQKFLKSLKQAALFYNCELAIIPSHYRNLTLFKKGDVKEYDPTVVPYLVKGEIQFGNVKIKSDVRIQPTTVNPLGGKQSHGGQDWIVFGHPQLAREPVATSGDQMPKLMFTTGSVTYPNYSVSDAGEKGKWHHCNAAIILEKYKDDVFVRQISTDSKGHCYDLDAKFTPSGYSTEHSIAALTPGDEHVKFNAVEKATYGKGGLTEYLKPKCIVRNDVFDGYAGSHHHLKDPMIQFVKHHSGDNDYRAELDQTVDFINRTTPDGAKTLIVPSNHHDHFAQFLQKADVNTDHTNALLIAEMQIAMRNAALSGMSYDPFYLYCKDKLTCNHEFLSRTEPYYIGVVDHSQHGDVGTNGSRGSARGLAKTPDKLTIGHSHGARIVQGVYQVGTSTNRLEYERGLGDHSKTHCIQYKDDKRTLIDHINGRFYAPRPRGK